MPTPLDQLRRPLRNLRLSVTDRCNLRCSYCMPEEEYVWLPRRDLLTFEELERLVEAFTRVGVHKLRLTGGEPLLRQELPELVRRLRRNERLEEVAMTTNGVLLAEHAEALRDAGLGRVTVSLDSLDPGRFERLTRRRNHAAVLEGIESVRAAGFLRTKIDTVVVRGVNDDELPDLIDYGRRVGAEVRFIEYMDVGGATRWSMDQVVSREEMLARIEERHGPARRRGERNSAPADRFVLADGTVFGIISSTTDPFCSACDRSRLTADGTWYTCLYATRGRDLRAPLRAGASLEQLCRLLEGGWSARSDRGAEERLAAAGRGALVPAEELRRDPRLEMHTRGG
jgi:cyclic pyranopterin phosphate synthase